jgi:hypothetical protein
MSPTTVEAARLAITANQQEIAILLAQNPVDHLAVQQLQSENARHLDRLRTAQHLTNGAPRKSRVDVVQSQFIPRAFAR